MLEVGAVIHNSSGKVGKVLLAEKSQRQLTQFLCQRNAPVRTFVINGGIGTAILQYGNKVHYQHESDTQYDIIGNAMRYRRRRIKYRTEIILEKQKDKHRRQHQCDIQQCSEKHAFTKVFRSFG